MAQVATCVGTPGSITASDGTYVATCTTAVQWEDYNPLLNTTVDESQAGQLWSQIVYVLIISYGIKVIARKFRR
jgi:hypothetical protein